MRQINLANTDLKTKLAAFFRSSDTMSGMVVHAVAIKSYMPPLIMLSVSVSE